MPVFLCLFSYNILSFVEKKQNICYNKDMENKNQKGLFSLLGEPTIEKSSGLAYSLSACMPAFFSVAFLMLLTLFKLMDENVTQKDWYRYASFLLMQLAIVATVYTVLKYQRKSVKTFCKEQKCSPKYLIVGLVLQIGLFSLSQLNTAFLKILGEFGYESAPILLPSMDGFGFVGVFFVVAVLPAILEETLFRGVLFNGLKSFGEVGAVLICGGLFSLYHQNPAQTAYQFCCGAAYALVALKSGSILPTVAAHLFNNGFVLVMTKINGGIIPAPWNIVVTAVSAVCLVLSLVYLLFIDKKPRLEKPKDNTARKNFFVFAAIGIIICAISWLGNLFTGL